MRRTGFWFLVSSFWFPRALLALLASSFILHPSSLLLAQDEPPPPKHPGMRITFLPPPMEGTLSLGIYDKAGKLVRVMAREATEKEFTIGLNGLITFWDGKDDAGQVMPPGVYYARGYSVGAVEVDGVALHGNDWITDEDAPRPARVIELHSNGDDKIDVTLRTLSGKDIIQSLHFDSQPSAKSGENGTVSISGGKLKFTVGGTARDLTLGPGETAIDATLGARNRVWVIVKSPEGTEVRAYSPEGEFLRRLSYAQGDPVPQRIFAARGEFPARWSEQIMLLEQNDKVQRVRSLALPQETANGAAPVWETVLEKSIWLGTSFDAVRDSLPKPGGKPFVPESEFVVHLIENPLLKNEPTTAHVSIGFNETGSFLQTTDGLPLRRITETPGLKWAEIGREGSGKLLTIFQSDGAVVEEFRASKLAIMMAFDAGDYEWTGK
jgi:hypothetical protein